MQLLTGARAIRSRRHPTSARASLIAAIAWTAAVWAFAPTDGRAQLRDMGHRAIATDGPRPLLTIMGEFSDEHFDSAPTQHDPRFYADLLFGDEGAGCCAKIGGPGGFFDDNSNGVFTFTPAPIPPSVPAGHRTAGILGPYEQPDNPDTTAVNESTYGNRGKSPRYPCFKELDPVLLPGVPDQAFATRCNMLWRAVQDGFPFRSFDRNGDACVTNDELTIMVVFAEPGAAAGGQSAGVGPVRLPGTPSLALCPYVSNLGEGVGAATVAHELTHTLGGQDTYGSSCRNEWYTITSCTIREPDERKVVHMDPFHKMKLGWLRPALIATTSAPSCVSLKAIDQPSVASSSRAYVIHDPGRGPNEYFILEYRLPTASNHDGDPWNTGAYALPDEGLAIWSVRIDPASKRLLEIPSIDGTGGTDAAMFLIPPSGTPGHPTMDDAGYNGLWLPVDGTAKLRWLSDDSPATLVSVQSIDKKEGTMTVRIGGGSCPPASP